MISRCVVRWADGSHDSARTCIDCGLATCPTPVYPDFYREIVTGKSYWNWVEECEKRDGKTEAVEANPDVLEGAE